MSGPTSSNFYFFDQKTTLTTNILTNGKASFGDYGFNVNTAPYYLNVNGNMNTNGVYYSNDVSACLIPVDTSANRPNPIVPGYLRLNTTSNLLEYSDINNLWIPIAVYPVINSVFPSTLTAGQAYDLSLNGYNFESNALVSFISPTGTVISSITATVPANYGGHLAIANTGTLLTGNASPYRIRITNQSGQTFTLYNAFTVTGSTPPVFNTPSGLIGTINSATSPSSYSLLPVTATDPAGDIITYSISQGQLPPNLNLNANTGAITGTATRVFNDTTYTFTVYVTTDNNENASRQFSILVRNA